MPNKAPRWSEADVIKHNANLAEFEENSGRGIPAATIAERKRQAGLLKPKAAPKANKYGAQPTMVGGIRFDSKLEARRFRELTLLRVAGEIEFFLRQVPFWLPGNITYKLDFLIVEKYGFGDTKILFYEDCKGIQDRAGINKIKQVETLYGIKINLVKSARG